MPYGYHGRILHANLTGGELTLEHPSEAFYRTFMGGSALGLCYLLRGMGAGVDALAPENILVLSLSVLTGAPFPGQSRMTAVAKSPLTDCVGDAQCGGFFPAEMKFAGFDALILRGRSPRPVYLWVHDGEAVLRPADHLWGRSTGEVEARIRQDLGDEKIEVLQCGPAGEARVRFAALINMCSRANGRTGMGAVMGSKNLRAVAVRGKDRPPVADRPGLTELARRGTRRIPDSDVYGLSLLGTSQTVRPQNAAGGLPSYNWASGVFEGWEQLDGRTLADTILKGRDTCFACPIRCKRVVQAEDGALPVDPLYGGPEYETIAAFGSFCGIDDLRAVAYANQLCNMYGMDTISCGGTIAWAMDCYEHGILTSKDTDGLDLRFGRADAMVTLTEKIARREGIGDILAEGSARAAAIIGRGSEELLVTVKKAELPGHMPQVKRSLGLVFAVNPFGPDHNSSDHDPGYVDFPARMAELGLVDPQPVSSLNREKVRFALTTQHVYSCLDSINLCEFVFGASWQLYGPGEMVDVVRRVTGWDVTLEELLRLGERRLNMMRVFNAREGIGRQDDVLPKKLRKALLGGVTDGARVSEEEIEQAKDWYYEMAGWDLPEGKPTRVKLDELGLGWLIPNVGSGPAA